MTRHRSAITHRTVWSLAGPIIASNISVPLVGAVDTAVVGRLPGPVYIGAVALGALIFSFLYWGFGFLRMGTTGFVARADGAGDQSELSRTYIRVLLLALILGVLVIALGGPIVRFALLVIDSSETVETLAAEYSYIRIWSAPATLCLYVFTGILIGLHNTRQVFLLMVVMNVINVVLDLVFVPWLGFGVAGVAWASLIAEYIAAALGFWILRKQFRIALANPNWPQILEITPVLQLLRSNSHIFIRTLCLVFSFAFFTAQGARLGEMILAANTILLHLQSIMSYGLDGFAHAVEALAGSAYGAHNRSRFRQAVTLTTWWAAAAAIITSLIYLFLGDEILTLFSNQESVITLASSFLPWMIIAPIISVWSFQLDGIFIGAGHTLEMRNAMIVSTLGYLALAWFLLPLLGNHGLFLALSLFMLLRALSLYYYYPGIKRAI
ncbi:MAG: MATE family efflux transporter [bacterium]